MYGIKFVYSLLVIGIFLLFLLLLLCTFRVDLQPRDICLEAAKYYKFILYFTMLRFEVNLEFLECSFLNE